MRSRTLLLAALLTLLWATPSRAAQDPEPGTTRSHGIAVLGTPALPADFPYFPYVNPDAPKGGEVTFAMSGSFDGFNPFILGGNPAMGIGAAWQPGVGGTAAGTAVGHVWESLLVPSADEVATAYGHLAGTVEMPTDRMWVAFEIRPEARFADGTPVTAEDVAWTYNTLITKGAPSFRVTFADVAGVEVQGPRRVVFRFRSNENRELPLLVGSIPVLPEHWWATRDFTKPLTEVPMGSGPYRVESFDLGRTVTYARRDDWWAKNRPTGRGLDNFDKVRIEYYRDDTVLFEAFKSGRSDWRQEYISRQWKTGYDFPAMTAGLVKRDTIPHRLPIGMDGLAFNTRRPQFQDPRVREAISLAFDFEWMNKALFYDAYTRTSSYFGDTDEEATGLPEPDERTLLEPFREELPPELFTQSFTIPKTDGSGQNREGLRQALRLLEAAGWTVKDRHLVNAAGQPMAFTLLSYQASYEKVLLPLAQQLGKLGMDVQVRTVDPAQYERLTDDFDFDVGLIIYPGSDLPGTELRDEFTCESAKVTGSSNLAGACDPAVDALVHDVIQADTRPKLRAAGRALDRVLMWRWYLVPTYHSQVFNIAYWDRFGRPDKPVRSGYVLDSWWVDPARAAKVDAGRGAGAGQ
jgi:microcin C transport system substrate-binding protein